MTTREPYKGQRIGNLRERVTLQDFTSTDDGFGGRIEEWYDVAEVWARIEPVKAGEQLIAGGIQSITDVLVHVRHRDDITSQWRIIWRGIVYRITGARNLDERGQFLTLDATSW